MTPRTTALLAALALLAAAPLIHAAETPAAATTPAAPAASADLGAALASAFGALLDQSSASDAKPFSLPDTLAKIQAAAKVAGKSEVVDQLAAKLNTSSSDSYSSALGLVKTALANVSWGDTAKLKSGTSATPDSVTQLIRKSVGSKLRAQLLPLVKKSVAAAGVPDQYKQLLSAAGPAAALFGKPGISDLESYVTDKTLDSVFSYLGKQEAALRANPSLSQNPTVQKAFALLGAK